MKKSKLIAGLSAAFVGLIALASCSGSVTSAGDVLLYYNGKGYTAEELFNEKISTSEGAQAAFNAVYKVAVRNWANSQDSGLKREIENETKNKVSSAKADAQSNASKNGTSYDTEFKKILSSNGVDNETGLYNKFEYDIQKEKFEDKFYDDRFKIGNVSKTNYDILKEGGKFRNSKGKEYGDEIAGYLDNKHPYHMKHILVKLTESANYKQETITEKNATDIAAVITTLAKGDTSFGNVARAFQEIGDSGSAKELGSVGIMDVDTSFVDEFKLGTYIYESFYGHSTQKANGTYSETNPYISEVASSKLFKTSSDALKHATDIANYNDPSSMKDGTSQGIGTIPYEAAVKLGEWAGKEFTQKFLDVTGGTKNDKFLPRNVLFNKYFNRHNICVITPNRLNEVDNNTIYKGNKAAGDYYITGDSGSQKRIKAEKYTGNYDDYTKKTETDDKYINLKGFNQPVKNNDYLSRGDTKIQISNDDQTKSTTKVNSDKFLRDTDGRIIFVVRGKDGLHFIVVERSPFILKERQPSSEPTGLEFNKTGVTREEYFSTVYPTEPNVQYPQYEGTTTNKQTFVTYAYETEPVKYKALAKTVKDKLKSSDPNLNKYIYRFLVAEGNLQFQGRGETIKVAIDNWIDRTINFAKYENEEKWDKSWEDYYWKLEAQKERRADIPNKKDTPDYYTSELVPEVCAIAMANAKLDTPDSGTKYVGTKDLIALFGPGGIFYEQASK